MEVEVEVGEGSNVGRTFDKTDARGEESTRGERKHNHYRKSLPGSNTVRLHARHLRLLRRLMSKCIGGATALSESLVACCTGLGSAWSRRS